MGSLIADGSLQVQYFLGGDGVRALADLLDELVGLSMNGAALSVWCAAYVALPRSLSVFCHERTHLPVDIDTKIVSERALVDNQCHMV
ncbi:MAG: hypothetical protein H6651_03365 [Ardenticatenales bacterium]|nr:hypothetical protein [Ardenticatenales bacterium]